VQYRFKIAADITAVSVIYRENVTAVDLSPAADCQQSTPRHLLAAVTINTPIRLLEHDSNENIRAERISSKSYYELCQVWSRQMP
jgi:hypothetical protein